MNIGGEILLNQNNVKLVPKVAYRSMRFLSIIMFWDKARLIMYPTKFSSREAALSSPRLEHEIVHVVQAGDSLGSNLWFLISYFLLPVPILFAWFRFRYEVEAYVKGLERRTLIEMA